MPTGRLCRRRVRGLRGERGLINISLTHMHVCGGGVVWYGYGRVIISIGQLALCEGNLRFCFAATFHSLLWDYLPPQFGIIRCEGSFPSGAHHQSPPSSHCVERSTSFTH